MTISPNRIQYNLDGTCRKQYQEYPHDVGTSHIIEYYLALAMRDRLPASIDLWSSHPHRYADGEEELMELYR